MRRVFALALGAAMLAGPAFAQNLSASDPEGIVGALQDLGYRATLEQSGTGSPMISLGVAGVNTTIFFYGCEDDGTACEWIQFYSGFDMDEPFTARDANAWNSDNLFGVMAVDDEGDPRLMYFTSMTGGMTRDNFADVVDWWDVALADFLDVIGW